MTERTNDARYLSANQVAPAASAPLLDQDAGKNSADRRIVYLSTPMAVNMGDWWFDIATVDHFWIRRRFDVTVRLADTVLRKARCVAEIGCGNGLLQRELEDSYGMSVAGFDLNQLALRKNVSRVSPLYCYDVHQRDPQFRAQFDLLFLFDVLEHIEDDSAFLQSVKFHLSDSGSLLVNVPAHQFFHSDYDRAAGHIRRYSANQLSRVAEVNGFKICALTYWGLPLVPLLLARKGMSMRRTDGKAGFDTRGSTINSVLACLARCEPLPQRFLGTSVMAVLQNDR